MTISVASSFERNISPSKSNHCEKIWNVTIHTEENIFILKKSDDNRINVEAGRADIIHRLVWKETKIPCVWSFKRARYRKNDILCTAQCSIKSCAATLTGIYPHESNKLEISIKNFNINSYHSPSKKRKVTKHNKALMRLKLKDSSAYYVRSKLADSLMDAGDIEPPHLPSANAMRVIKSKAKSEKMLEKNQILSLMSINKQFPDSVQKIGVDPLFVFYSTPLQRLWYKAETFRKRAVISIDATGLGLQPFTDDKKPIFMYLITCQGL